MLGLFNKKSKEIEMLNFIKRLFGIKTEVAEVAVAPTVNSNITENDVSETPVIEKPVTTNSTVENKTPAVKPVKKSSSDFNAMTVSQLLEYAATNGVDVKKSWKKAKIVETIAAHLKAN